MSLKTWINHFLNPPEYSHMAKIDDAVARLEASQSAHSAAVTALVNAAAVHKQLLADAVSGSGNDALAARLDAVSTALDTDTADLLASEASLTADAPPANPAPAA